MTANKNPRFTGVVNRGLVVDGNRLLGLLSIMDLVCALEAGPYLEPRARAGAARGAAS